MQQSVALQCRFVADVAHQLRTPVAGIRVLALELDREFGSELGSAEPGAQDCRPILGERHTSTARLSRLIGQLLRLAGSETALTMHAEHVP